MRCILLAAAAALLFSCGPKTDISEERTSQNIPEAATAPRPAPPQDIRPVILAFGDSLSAGFGLDSGQSYPDYLQEILDEEGYRYRVVNQGISGDTTSGGVARLQQGLAVNPDIVIVELGGNDGLRGLPVTLTKQNLETIVSTFQQAGAKVVLAGITLPRNYGAEYIGKFEEIYSDVASKYKTPRIGFLLDGVAVKPELMQRDQIHPTAPGNRIVARQNVFPVVEPLLSRKMSVRK